jgi:hypothetical protein
MTPPDLLAKYTRIVTQCVESYQNLRAACDKAIAAGAMDIDGPLHESIWNGFEKTIALLDVNGWLAWHIWENDCGKKQLTVQRTGEEPYIIFVPGDLAELMILDLPTDH